MLSFLIAHGLVIRFLISGTQAALGFLNILAVALLEWLESA
jgi:hypothetical protein